MKHLRCRTNGVGTRLFNAIEFDPVEVTCRVPVTVMVDEKALHLDLVRIGSLKHQVRRVVRGSACPCCLSYSAPAQRRSSPAARGITLAPRPSSSRHSQLQLGARSDRASPRPLQTRVPPRALPKRSLCPRDARAKKLVDVLGYLSRVDSRETLEAAKQVPVRMRPAGCVGATKQRVVRHRNLANLQRVHCAHWID